MELYQKEPAGIPMGQDEIRKIIEEYLAKADTGYEEMVKEQKTTETIIELSTF